MILSFYKKLLRAYGPQGWWPTTPPRGRSPRYVPRRSLANLTKREKFEVCLGAILTQNTSWKNVTKGLENLLHSNILDLRRLHVLSPRQLHAHLRPTGYFRQKTRRVKAFVRHLLRLYRGDINRFLGRPLPAVRRELLNLRGIGPETADSMLLYAQGKPVFVVDAYTRRIGIRWGVLSKTDDYDKIQARFMDALPRSARIYGECHALLVELAKRHCRSVPQCGGCPVKKICATGRRKI